MSSNRLFYGDNHPILRDYIASESVDLIYLDPPFNSNRNYNVLFRNEKGDESEAQIMAFEDTWFWNHVTEEAYQEIIINAPANVAKMISSLREAIGPNQMMAYLVMMTVRLLELFRVLKPTGSIYLHCDPNASHYLRVLMDSIFGPKNFRNHIIWKRADAHNDARKQFGALSDHILYYSRSEKSLFNRQHSGFQEQTLHDWYIYLELADGTVRRMTKNERETQIIPPGARRFNADNLRSPNPRPNLTYEYKGYKPHPNGWAISYEKMCALDAAGLLLFPSEVGGRIMRKRYLDEQEGAVLGDVWTDISQLRGADTESLGYPTQKPLPLLERIIKAGSNEGDTILDPFCGCGTAIAAAEKLNRKWIGIDITHLSIALLKYRLHAMFPDIHYDLVGEPTDLDAACNLALENRYQFQWWALSLIRAKPLGGQEGSKVGKKGSDKGIDGVIDFIDDASHVHKRILVQVKSGHVKSGDIRDLLGTIDREKAEMGVFITLEEPSRDMRKEAITAGTYASHWGQHPRLQILTIAQLLDGAKVDMPPQSQVSITFKQAQKTKRQGQETAQLTFDEAVS